VWVIALTALAGCGSQHEPRSSQAVSAALTNLHRVVSRAVHPPAAQPGFKVPASRAKGLHDLDLWNAIVDPMIGPLLRLDGTSALHQALSPPQYAVYALFVVDTDIDDGGLWEVYYNPSGVFADEAVHLLELVGAPRHAAVLAKANRIAWPSAKVPASDIVRRHVLLRSAQTQFDAVNNAWDRAEREEGTIYSIIDRFIRTHPTAFFS
jgi:hypothetical protein